MNVVSLFVLQQFNYPVRLKAYIMWHLFWQRTGVFRVSTHCDWAIGPQVDIEL
jgi:hypothetical protein